MNPYIVETQYAVENLIALVYHEELLLTEKLTELANTESRYKIHNLDFQTSDMSEDFSDAYVISAFNRMAQAFVARDVLKAEIDRLQFQIGVHQSSVQSLCGSILQIAKQGISIVHGGLGSTPQGRAIGSLALRDVVWEGRNQSIHYEEGNFKKGVTNLFSALALEQGSEFCLATHSGKNRALQVMKLLGWVSYAAYIADMQLLLP